MRKIRLQLGLIGSALAISVAALAMLAGAAWGQPQGSALAAAATVAGWGGAYEVYQVQAGDTVENVAARFGIAPELVRNLNVLGQGTALAPGQDLAIPLPGSAKDTAGGANAGVAAVGRMVPPRYAAVKQVGRITSEPDAGRLLYEPVLGTRLVVKVDRGSHWGVVMVDGSIGWMDKACLEMSDQTLPPEQLEALLRGARPDIVLEASRYLGTPYRYGASLPEAVDCSALAQAACAARGFSLPRTAAAQFEVGRPVNLNELAPGDRLYFVSKSGRISHTGIYKGDGEFIHASARRGCVAVDSLSEPFYWSRFIGARRF